MVYYTDVIAYFAMLVSLTLAPGPLSAILVAKTLAGDRRGALLFGSGIALGDTLIIIVVCSGLGTWLSATPVVFTLGKILAIGYILWVALWILMKDKSAQHSGATCNKRLIGEIGSGMFTCIASPQTLLLYLVLVPGLIDLQHITLPPLIVLLTTTMTALLVSVLAIVFLAQTIRHWVGPRQHRSPGDWVLAAVVAGSGLSILAM